MDLRNFVRLSLLTGLLITVSRGNTDNVSPPSTQGKLVGTSQVAQPTTPARSVRPMVFSVNPDINGTTKATVRPSQSSTAAIQGVSPTPITQQRPPVNRPNRMPRPTRGPNPNNAPPATRPLPTRGVPETRPRPTRGTPETRPLPSRRPQSENSGNSSSNFNSRTGNTTRPWSVEPRRGLSNYTAPPGTKHNNGSSLPESTGSNIPHNRGPNPHSSNSNAQHSGSNGERREPNQPPRRDMPSRDESVVTPFAPGNGRGRRNRYSRFSGLIEASVIGNLMERFQDLLNEVSEKSELFMRSLRRRYPPFKRMFEGAEDMRDRLSSSKRRMLEKLMQSGENEITSGGYNLTDMSADDVMRLLDDLDQISEPVRDKLVTFLPNCTDDELWKMPENILPAFTEEKFRELTSMSHEQLSILCDKLLDDGTSPWNLVTAIRGGLRCQPMRDLRGKKKCKTTIAKVMMDIVRVETPPGVWNNSFLQTALQYTGAGVKAEDIRLVPDDVFKESIRELSKTDLPMPSQREALVAKMTSGYATPTSWPDQLVKDLGKMLENVDYSQLMLVRVKAIMGAVNDLTEAGIQDDLTRSLLTKVIVKASKTTGMTPSTTAELFPWFKEDATFVMPLVTNEIASAVKENDLSLDDLTRSEAYMVSEKLEKYFVYDPPVMVPTIVPHFPMSALEAVPDDIISQMKNRTRPIRSIRKARLFARRLKRILANESKPMVPSDMAFVLYGLDLDDVRDLRTLDDLAALDSADVLRSVEVPNHFAYHLVHKASSTKSLSLDQAGHTSTCDDFLLRLGKMAKHLYLDFIINTKLLPVANDDELCSFDVDEIEITQSQAYAIVDNIRERIGSIGDNGSRVLKPALIKRLGKLVTGLAAEDIEKLPTDTELLTVIEVLAKYEDELDSHQIQAIVQKIRDYFDLPNRRTVDELTEITAHQIGRFLQYLNVEFELTKFPQQFRPEIMREIGKSSLTKISTPHRQNLLTFALRNSRLSSGAMQDATRGPILHEHVIDLGRLVCGLTEQLLGKMADATVNRHIRHMQTCPFKEDIAKALLNRVMAIGSYRFNFREHMLSMAGLLTFLTDDQIEDIDQSELVPILEYILKALDSRDSAWHAAENSGFIRERTVKDRQRHQQQRKRLIQTLYLTNKEYYDFTLYLVDQCAILMRFGDEAAELGIIEDRCADELALIRTWKPADARKALETVTKKKLGSLLNKEVVGLFTEDMIKDYSGLMKGLTPEEMSMLNLTQNNVYFVGSAEGYTAQQLRIGVEKVFPGSKESLRSEDLINLGNFVCGITPDEIRSISDKETVRNAIGALSGRRGCSEEQLVAYAEKLSETLGPTVQNWSMADIHAMGHILGGLKRQQLIHFTRRQIQAIAPSIISAMQPEKVSNFTVKQLKEFSPMQSNAVTSMQRSYMSKPQVAALKENLQGNYGVFALGSGFTHTTISLATLACSFLMLLLVLTDYNILRDLGLP